VWNVLDTTYCLNFTNIAKWPPLWSSSHSSWLQIQRSRIRFPALPDFLRSSGPGPGSTQPREYNWGATWKKNSGSGLENREYGRRHPSRRPRGTLYPQKLVLISPTSGGRSVGIVRSRTQTTEFFFLWLELLSYLCVDYIASNGRMTERWEGIFRGLYNSLMTFVWEDRLMSIVESVSYRQTCLWVAV
jgi:hypothetical protein